MLVTARTAVDPVAEVAHCAGELFARAWSVGDDDGLRLGDPGDCVGEAFVGVHQAAIVLGEQERAVQVDQ